LRRERHKLWSFDVKQAFLNADAVIPDLYVELPDLPFEMEGSSARGAARAWWAT
jgi:hypothetical protein